jgi:D-glycero-alpha-D-manno-heptose-7-phosphate kinase
MLIAQGPLRVSLFGGGSDLPAFLAHNDGAVLSFAIDRRVFVVGHPFTHRHGILLKYSQTEDVDKPHDLKHPIAREVLTRYDVNDLDIAVMSDVPAGTGLGSSSSFTVAFLAFVRHTCGLESTAVELAREACEIEIEVLKEPIGYQDQWASATGGVNLISFSGGDVRIEKIGMTSDAIGRLQRNLHLVPIGSPRSAGKLLARQGQQTTAGSKSESFTRGLVELVEDGRQALLTDVDAIGPLLHKAWSLKRQVTSGVSNPDVDALYERGLTLGATGGKLLGAGGSGYLAFYVPDSAHERFRAALPGHFDFAISAQGAGIIHES